MPSASRSERNSTRCAPEAWSRIEHAFDLAGFVPSASLVFHRLGPDGIQPLLSFFTRSDARLKEPGIADHVRKVLEHQYCGWFRGGHLHAFRRGVGAESALAIFVFGGIALPNHEVTKAELAPRTREPQVHVPHG